LKRTLEQVTHGRELWFKAEIAKLTTSPSGHMYLELVEEAEGVRLASMRGTLWKSQRAKVLESLGESAQHVLSPGTEIVFTANIQYHPVYGISLVIEDIDVSAMIGEAEKRKRETLANLKAQGALEWNKAIALPRLVQRVALIGSPGTSGFRDFGTHLMLNEWGVGFDVEVFPATVQGKDAPGAICLALEKAAACNPDAVVLVRGGGSALDLDAFNNLDLCLAIAQCPHAVLTGIGHETDLSVADLVAHRSFKTPTAVADFLVDRLVNEGGKLAEWRAILGQLGLERLAREREQCAQITQALALHPQQMLAAEALKLSHAREHMASLARQALERHAQKLNHMIDTVQTLSPQNTLRRGFSLVHKDGKSVSDAGSLSVGDVLHLRFHRGSAEVTVSRVSSTSDE
jgi:exodeoxyribonuclease VII large subunit